MATLTIGEPYKARIGFMLRRCKLVAHLRRELDAIRHAGSIDIPGGYTLWPYWEAPVCWERAAPGTLLRGLEVHCGNDRKPPITLYWKGAANGRVEDEWFVKAEYADFVLARFQPLADALSELETARRRGRSRRGHNVVELRRRTALPVD